jgi:hypothetical protein
MFGLRVMIMIGKSLYARCRSQDIISINFACKERLGLRGEDGSRIGKKTVLKVENRGMKSK